jgi:type II secretory pathway component HofQ
MVPVVKNFLSERGTVSVDERTNTLIVRDISKNIEEIRELFR